MTANVSAVVLNQEDWRTHDALLTLYTREQGKVVALARGLRKFESKLAGHLEPLTVAEVFLVEGRMFPLVAGSVVLSSAERFTNNLDDLLAASAVVRLVDRVTPLENREEPVFRGLDEALTALASLELDARQRQFLVACFSWKLLAIAGYQPDLNRCVACRVAVDSDEAVCFDQRRSSAVHPHCGSVGDSFPLTAPVRKGLAYMARAPLQHLTRLRARVTTFDQMVQVIHAVVEERFEVSARSSAIL